MAKKVWDNPIDKSVDWGGDESTGGLPVSGAMIQKFIKESLDDKAGCFYYDTTSNRYLVFADEASRDEYLEDTTKTELLIGAFDAPFNYNAEITLTSPAYNAVFLNSTGNYIDFTFDVKNKQGASTGENVTVTYTFMRNSIKQVVRENRRFGESVHFNVDKYLGEGTNVVTVGIIGQSTLAATTVSITYQVVNLTISDEMNIATAYDLSEGSKTLAVPFSVSGYGTKTVEWYLDGEKLPFVKAEDEIVDVSATRTKYITLSNLQQGRHSLQFRAYTIINGENFYTDTLYRDIIVYTGSDSNLIFGVAATIPFAYGVLGGADVLSIYNMVQYIPYTLRFATYSPSNAANSEVVVTLDGETVATLGSNNGVENNVSVISKTSGNKTLVLTSGEVSYPLNVLVSETSMNLQEISLGLAFDFNAIGKSNNSSDRDYWASGEYEATLEGFNWNNNSGWVNDRLEMNAGSSIAFNYAPLAGAPTSTGKTIEMEWSTKNVIDDNAVICDLRGVDGAGILITATKVSLYSKGGVVIDTEYKSDENVRLGFVINKSSGSTYQKLSFIYANGIISRCESWAGTDSYASSKEIKFTATENAEISLKAIRVYDVALTPDEMLNNYVLYRDNVDAMMGVYDRNDVYAEGSTTFDPERMMGRLPVMIVTGNIPVLENTSDKDTQIIVDVEYTNMQDPTKSFRMEGAAMRPQGTSSMGYPKKNFRIYTRKVDSTKVYDYEGKLIADKLYAFKDGAQPVDCWCLKADYAESSGTHNTGIARLWNKALYDARVTYSFGDGDERNIVDKTVLRTNAQQIAADNGYPYDVRTTIDGFPILLFYRLSSQDELIFIGKYNFNNDKSTESVFGFTGIPGFNNEKMQCWEVLNNGNALALFTTVDGFDSGWSEAFEARYPDKSTKVSDLKAFCTWMSGVSQEDFAAQKWEHLDVYKMAAYWIYLMRHAGADQFVKNAMFTSEDGVKWYYILYDNDTINGLINTGRIAINPTDGRQTVDATGSYVFAGHDSRLWNMLEADEEFNAIVSAVDNALYSAGISYINTIKIFDDEQADKWVERVYNQDAQYKYVGPYIEKGVNNLFMLQGKRDLHRRWWLAKRYSIFDAKYVSGTYKSQAVELKCINGTPEGQQFTIKAGMPLDYGYGINNVPRVSGISLDRGESHTFTTSEVVNIGDPIRIYGAPNLEELDLSKMASRLTQVNIAGVYDEALGTMLKKLVIGKAGVENLAEFAFSGLTQAKKLEYLDIQGIKDIKSLDLSNQPNFKTLVANGSSISSVTFAKGAPVESISLPSTMTNLSLEQLPYLKSDNISFEDIKNVDTLVVKDCPKVSNDFDFVYNWYRSKSVENAYATLTMDNIDWKNVDANMLAEISGIGNLDLKGKVVLSNITIEQLNMLMDVFGETAFDKDSDFFINAPDAIFVTGRTELLEGESEDYSCVVFGGEVKKLTWSIVSGGDSYVSINTETGLLTTTEGTGNRTLVIKTAVLTDSGAKNVDTTVNIKARTYPGTYTTKISGNTRLSFGRKNEYSLVFSTETNGNIDYEWSLSGLDGYAELIDGSKVACHVEVTSLPSTLVNGSISCSVIRRYDKRTLFTLSMDLELINDTIAETDLGVVTALYNAGLCANPTYITKEEAAEILESDLNPTNSYSGAIFYNNKNIKSFEGFKWFINLTSVPTYCFYKCSKMKSINLPEQITLIGSGAFDGCTALTSVNYGDLVEEIGYSAFGGCKNLKDFTFKEGLRKVVGFNSSGLTSVVLPSTIEEIGNQCFYGCNSLITADLSKTSVTELDGTFSYSGNLETVLLPDTVSKLINTFQNCKKLRSVNVPKNLKSLSGQSFYSTLITSFVLPEGLTSIASYTFRDCVQLSDIGTIPESIETIGEWAFYNSAVDLGDVTLYLPNLKNIPSSACFAGLGGRISIDVGVNNNNYTSEDGVLYTKGNGPELRCYAKDRLNPNPVITKEGLQRAYFQGCKYLKSVILPDSVWVAQFEQCESLESATLKLSSQIHQNMFKGCTSLKNIDLTGVTTIFERAFEGCKSLTFLEIPETVTSIGTLAFHDCVNLSGFYFHGMTAPSISSSTFGTNQGSVTGWNTRESGNKLIIPEGATGYDGTNWQSYLLNPSYSNFTIYPDYEATECTSLIITADDVRGKATETVIRYTAITNGYSGTTGEQVMGVPVKGTAISEPFSQNTSTTESIEIDISFTYLGVTATTTITQGVWINEAYSVDLNSQWQKSSTIANPDDTTYDGVYESFSNKGISSSAAIMYIVIDGYDNFKFYVRSYAEGGCDFVVVSNLDALLANNIISGESVKMITAGKQTSGTEISSYTLVEFTGIGGGEHCITIMYRKDSSTNVGDDRGYVLIPKEQ